MQRLSKQALHGKKRLKFNTEIAEKDLIQVCKDLTSQQRPMMDILMPDFSLRRV
jgi:hypothetical protein